MRLQRRPAAKIITNDTAYATQLHPLVRTHPETGAETLFSTLGYIIGIDGMSDDEALPLLDEARRDAVDPLLVAWLDLRRSAGRG